MIDLEILKQQNNLTISDNGMVYVRPLQNGSWTTYPLGELAGCIALSPEDYVLLKAGYYQINENKDGIKIREIVDEEEED